MLLIKINHWSKTLAGRCDNQLWEMIARLLPKTKKNQQQQDIMLTYKKIKTLVYSEMEHTRENKPRFTLAAAYIRH